MQKIPKGYDIRVSTRKNKKYDVYKNGKYLLSFGAIKENGVPYEQYKDQFGYYSNYDHLDKERKKNFWKRHTKSNDPTSASYWNKLLW